MPAISRFFGIVIYMYPNDHAPPHFHAIYGDDECMVRIAPLGIIEGRLPPRAMAMVIEWASIHQQELIAAWNALRARQTPMPIEPLK